MLTELILHLHFQVFSFYISGTVRGVRDHTTVTPSSVPRQLHDISDKAVQTPGINNGPHASPGQHTIGLMSTEGLDRVSKNKAVTDNPKDHVTRKTSIVMNKLLLKARPSDLDIDPRARVYREDNTGFTEKQEVSNGTGSTVEMQSGNEEINRKQLTSTGDWQQPVLNSHGNELVEESSVNISQRREASGSLSGLFKAVANSRKMVRDNWGSTAQTIINSETEKAQVANNSFNNQNGGLSSAKQSQDLNQRISESLNPSKNDSSWGFISNEQIEDSPGRVHGGAAEREADDYTGPTRSFRAREKLIRGDLTNETRDLQDAIAYKEDGQLLSNENVSAMNWREGGMGHVGLNGSDGHLLIRKDEKHAHKPGDDNDDSDNINASKGLQLPLQMENNNGTHLQMQMLSSFPSSQNASSNISEGLYIIPTLFNTSLIPSHKGNLYNHLHLAGNVNKQQEGLLLPGLTTNKPQRTNHTSATGLQLHSSPSQHITPDSTTESSAQNVLLQNPGHIVYDSTANYHSPSGRSEDYTEDYAIDNQTHHLKGAKEGSQVFQVHSSENSGSRSDLERLLHTTTERTIVDDLSMSSQGIKSGNIYYSQNTNDRITAQVFTFQNRTDNNDTDLVLNNSIDVVNDSSVHHTVKSTVYNNTIINNLTNALVNTNKQSSTSIVETLSNNTENDTTAALFNSSQIVSQVQSPESDTLYSSKTSTTTERQNLYLYYTYKDKLEEILQGAQTKARNNAESTPVTRATTELDTMNDWNYTGKSVMMISN